MNDNNSKYIVLEDKRKKLGEFIRDLRMNKNSRKYGVNELAEAIGVNNSVISNLENGKIQKINPFLLQDVAKVLEVDYRILYRIIGFLDDREEEIAYPVPKELLQENNILIIWKGKKREIINLSDISKKGINDLQNYVKFLEVNYKDYQEFKKWKKEMKKSAKLEEFMEEYCSKQLWNESSRYRVKYDKKTVEELFDKKGLKLNEKGKYFLDRYIGIYGDDELEEYLKDKDGKELTGSKREYKLAKFVREKAVTAFID